MKTARALSRAVSPARTPLGRSTYGKSGTSLSMSTRALRESCSWSADGPCPGDHGGRHASVRRHDRDPRALARPVDGRSKSDYRRSATEGAIRRALRRLAPAAYREPQCVEEVVDVGALLDHGMGAGGLGLALEPGVGRGGVEHDFRRRRPGAQRAAQREAALVARPPVEEHDVGPGLAQGGAQLVPVSGGADADEPRLGAQDSLQPGAQNGMIVDDQDPDHVRMMLA